MEQNNLNASATQQVTAATFDITTTVLFKHYLGKAVEEVKDAAENAGVSPEGFTIDGSFCDFGGVKTGVVADYIDEFACHFGVNGDDNYNHIVKVMCESITTAFASEEARSVKLCELLPGIDGSYFQWLKPVVTDDGLRYLHIGGDEVKLSELMFEDVVEAIEAIENNIWGWSPEEAIEDNYALVKVSKTMVPFRFNVNTGAAVDAFVEQYGEGPTDVMSHVDFTSVTTKALIEASNNQTNNSKDIFPSVIASSDLENSEHVGIFFDWLKENTDSGLFFSEDQNGVKVYPYHVLDALAHSPNNQIEILKLYVGDWLQDNIDVESEIEFGITFGGETVDSKVMLSVLN